MKTRITFSIIFAFLFSASWMMPAKAQDLTAGKKLLETGQVNAALRYFTQEVQKNSQSAEALFYLGETYMAKGKPDSAVIYYEKGQPLNKKFSFNEAGLGRVAMVKGDTTKAKEYFDSAIKSNKKNVDLYAYAAEAAIEANQPKIAAAYIARGKEVNVKNGAIHMAEGDLWRLKNVAGEAVNAYERVNDYDKNNALAYVKIGNIFTDARTWNVAEDNYKKAIAIDPNYAPAYKGLAEMNFRHGDFKAASDNIKKYVSLVPDLSFEDNYQYALILFSNKEYTDASKLLDQLLKKEPNNPVLLRLQAYMSYDLGVDENGKVSKPDNISQAYNYLNKFMQVQAKDKFIPRDYEYMAKIEMALGMNDKAPANFLKAYQLDTTKVDLVESAAKAYAKAEMFDSAAVTYIKLTKISDTNVPLNNFYAGVNYYLAVQKDTAKADSVIKMQKLVLADTAFSKVVTLSPALGYLWMGRTEFQMESIDQSRAGLASNSFQKLIEVVTAANEQQKRKNDLRDAYNYFAYQYYMKAYNARAVEHNNTAYVENRDKSLDYWNKILELFPNDSKAIDGIKAVNELAKIQTKPKPQAQQQ